MLKKILKWTGIVLAILIVAAVVVGFVLNEPVPEGKPGPEAEALAEKMQQAIDIEAWDSTRYVTWVFMDMHTFLWDKQRNLVEVTWGDKKVLLNTQTVDGKAYEAGSELSGDAAKKLIEKAWAYFCNDSFWLNAPAKAFDPGTERELVLMEDGSEALKVSYTSGGVTPGDTYLWLLDENGLPYAWKMWVKVLPVGGLQSGWTNWIKLSTGAKIATEHKSSGFGLEMKGVKGGMTLDSVGLTVDPFASL